MAVQATNYDGTREYEVAEVKDVYRPNLLINGDFQCWQRGDSVVGGGGSRNYGADMWYTSTKNVTMQKDINGLKVNTKASIGQFITTNNGKLKVGKPYTLVASINNKITVLNFIGGTQKSVALSGAENIYYQINWDGKEFVGVTNLEPTSILNYVDLFEGDIAYPHVKEDYALALKRCQRYIYVQNPSYFPVTLGWSNSPGDHLSWSINHPVLMESNPSVSYEYSNSLVQFGQVTQIYGGPRVNVKPLGYKPNTVIRFYKVDNQNFHTSDTYYAYMKVTISCEPL